MDTNVTIQMRNIRLDVEYDGTSFAGWQRQPNGIVTVQGEIEASLGKILQEKVNLTAAGRTDRGFMHGCRW